LFISRLRVNLISRKKLYVEYYLYSLIKLDSFTIVLYNFVPYLTFTKKNSIYMLSKIAKQLGHVQLGNKKYIMLCAINANAEQAELDLGLKEARELPLADQDILEKKKALFHLFHRRFAYIGVEKLRSLHKVTTLAQPVLIVPNKDCPCYICALIKIRNRRGPTIERKVSILKLVLTNIYRPLNTLREGHRYFLLIVDNYSRKH